MSRDMEKYQRPSEKQVNARTRNFRIFRLRGLHANLGMMSEPRRHLARALLDDELHALGAETETARQARLRALYEEI